MPQTQKKLIVRKLSTNFRKAVNIETCDICMPKDGQVCIRNKYVGITGDDIHIVKGRAHFVRSDVPFGCGLEGMGHVAAVGKGVSDIKVGDPVVYLDFEHSVFSEYTCVKVSTVYPIPEVKPEYLVLSGSGVSAMIGVEKFAKLKKGEKVLITAASGALGNLTVQLAKNIGCYVVGTCSMEEKVQFLKDLGCDYVINYGNKDLDEVLSKEFPEGMDVIWDSVGGPLFETCLRHICDKGRIVIMGETSGSLRDEKERFRKTELSSLKDIIFYKGASVIGGNVDVWYECWGENFQRIMRSYEKGDIKAFFQTCDGKKEFIGMEGIIEAMEHLFRGKHTGKVLAKIY